MRKYAIDTRHVMTSVSYAPDCNIIISYNTLSYRSNVKYLYVYTYYYLLL